MRQFTILPAFNIVAAGSTSVLRLPRNRRYHAIFLQYKTNAAQATIEADLTAIRVKVNGKIVREFSAAQLYVILGLNGIAFTLGMVPILFSEPKRRTPEGEEYLALNAYETLGIGDVDIEVDVAGGAAAPTLAAFASFDFERPADVHANPLLQTVMHWVKRVTPCAAAFPVAAPLTPANYFPNVNGWLHRAHFFDAVMTQGILRTGATPRWNATTVQIPALLIPYGLTKQANTFHMALDADQQYVNGLYLPSEPSLELDIVASGAAGGNAITSIIEVRKLLDRA